MTRLLLKLPWFIAAPLVVVVAGALAYGAYYLTGDYYHEECKNERNLLTGEIEPSNCGEGAKVAASMKETEGTVNEPSKMESASGGAVLATGEFTDADPAHKGSGTAELQRLPDGSHNLFLKNFSVTNGPDLFVVLSTSENGKYRDGDLVLARLQANNGNQNYAIPAGTDVTKFKSVVIWCKRFNVNFAGAVFETKTAANAPSPTAQATTTPAATPTAVPARTGVLLMGTFRDGSPGHTGSGSAQVQRLPDGTLNLFLGNFSVTNGPDLFVVLSESADGDYKGSDLTLGRLKANNGSQNYTIPPGTDVSKYRSVIIWCKSFSTPFAYATLES